MQAILYTLSDRYQQLVPNFVPQAVVYDLEVVQVRKQHRDLVAPPIRTNKGVFEAVHEQRSIRQTAERIVKRLMAELLLEGFAFSDVLEGHHRTYYFVVLEDRRAQVFDREARAVLPPKDLVVPTMYGPDPQRCVDRALFARIGGSVRFGVVQDVVYLSA